ncbi:MAG: acyl-CoA dehydrogenase family protein, partial [Hyphomicrobiales bacterium]|nr:acyl-CoA dehydrogenase family protein [Hyphomicrobiales bacterium]
MTAALRFDPIRLPPECEQLRKEVRAFLAEEIAAGTFDPHRPVQEDADNREFSRRVGQKGWLGMTWPKQYGGHERSFLERYVVTEEMRVANAPVRRFFVADRQSGPVLLKYAPEHIKMDILPRICRGEICFSIGMSEPNSGSDLFAAKTKATKTDGGFLINGSKIWITNSASEMTVGLTVQAVTGRRSDGRAELSCLIVPADAPGLTRRAMKGKMMWRASNTGELYFDNVRVPHDALLGKQGEGFKIMMETLDGGRLSIGAMGLGLAKGALAMTIKYANERKTFGVTIGKHQAIAFKLAEMATRIEAAEGLLYKAC